MRGLGFWQKVLVAGATLALLAAAALAFSAYQRPDLLLDLVGLRYCG